MNLILTDACLSGSAKNRPWLVEVVLLWGAKSSRVTSLKESSTVLLFHKYVTEKVTGQQKKKITAQDGGE